MFCVRFGKWAFGSQGLCALSVKYIQTVLELMYGLRLGVQSGVLLKALCLCHPTCSPPWCSVGIGGSDCDDGWERSCTDHIAIHFILLETRSSFRTTQGFFKNLSYPAILEHPPSLSLMRRKVSPRRC